MPKVIFLRIIHNLISKPLTYIGGFVFRLKYQQKNVEFDTSWVAGRERIYNYGINYWEEKLIEIGVRKESIDVLEVGCGNGQWLIAFSKFANRVVGIEPLDEVREFAKKKLNEFNIGNNVELKKGKAESIPYAENSFDLLFCSGVFMFVNQRQSLKEFNRVLKPGGKLILTVNGLGYFLMYIKNGIKFLSLEKTVYGVEGLIFTLIKWFSGKELGTSAVSVSEIDRILYLNGFDIYENKIWNQENLYPLDHFGMPTNYLFTAIKNKNI